MVRIGLVPEIQEDFDRILAHLAKHDVEDGPKRINEIPRAIDVLEFNPRIGRATAADTRELVIGRSARGYVALYRYVEELDTVFIIAIHGQREAGFERI
jgi:plasmid stabilization system protein ParE